MSAQSTTVPMAAVQTAGATASLYDRDHANHKTRDDFPTWLRAAAQQTGIRPTRLFLDYFAVRKGPGRLSMQDYFLYRLYDNAKFSVADKRKFISDRLHWPVTRKCCNMTWQAMTEDKWMSYTLLERFGLPIPETIAVVDATSRSYADTAKLSTPAQFRSFLHSCGSFPLFCKANQGLGSFGAFIITGVEGDKVLLENSDPVPVATLFAAITSSNRSYLVQPTMPNHAAIRRLARHVATVRMVNFIGAEGLRTPFAALKLPSSDNIADNFWRKGNLLADIDVSSGKLKRVIRGKGVMTEELETHPDSGDRLLGMQIPYWQEALDLNAAAVAFFPAIRYNSLDIAITDQGPVIVEMNTGGSFELPQLASGHGLLTDEVEAFFRSCGAPLR